MGLTYVSISALLLAAAIHAAEPVSDNWKSMSDQALVLFRNKDYAESIRVTEKALQKAEAEFGADSLQVAESAGNLSALYRLESKRLKDRAVAIRKKHGLQGVPLGIETEAFFDEVDRARQSLPRGEGQSEQQRATPLSPTQQFAPANEASPHR